MKLNKNLIGLFAGLALAGAANAQVTVTITGSTSFRAVAFDRGAALYDPASLVITSNGVALVTYSGTMSNSVSGFGATAVTMQFSFSGSAAGMLAVKGQTPVPFLVSGSSFTTNNAVPDLAFSDVFPAAAGINSGVDDNNIVGVIPFVWIRNNSLAHTFNITRDMAVLLASSSGLFTEDYFSGNTTNLQTVYLIGRDSGSGTRITTFADIDYVGSPIEWTTNFNGTQLVTTNLDGSLFGGYSSGGIERGVIAAFTGAIGYLGVSDANAITNSATLCSYNGVPFSVANVQNGTYGMWGYEHMVNRTGGLSANQAKIFNALVSAITNPSYQTTNPLYTSAFADLANMNCNRQADGGPIIYTGP